MLSRKQNQRLIYQGRDSACLPGNLNTVLSHYSAELNLETCNQLFCDRPQVTSSIGRCAPGARANRCDQEKTEKTVNKRPKGRTVQSRQKSKKFRAKKQNTQELRPAFYLLCSFQKNQPRARWQ